MCLSRYEQRGEYLPAPIAALRRRNQQVVKKSQNLLIVSSKRQLQGNTSGPRLSQTPWRQAEVELPSLRPSLRFPPCWVHLTGPDRDGCPRQPWDKSMFLNQNKELARLEYCRSVIRRSVATLRDPGSSLPMKNRHDGVPLRLHTGNYI